MSRVVWGMLGLGLGAGFLCGLLATTFFGDASPPSPHMVDSLSARISRHPEPAGNVAAPRPAAARVNAVPRQRFPRTDPDTRNPVTRNPVARGPVGLPQTPIVHVQTLEDQIEAATIRGQREADEALESADETARASVISMLTAERSFLSRHQPRNLRALLRALSREHEVVPMETVSQRDRFLSFLPRQANGARRDIPLGTMGFRIEPGEVLVARRGITRLRQVMPHRDMTIEGAGMDRSLLVLEKPLRARRGSVVTLRDLTIYLGDRATLDFSHDGVVRLERCRVIGFSKYVLRMGHGALHATDCEFDQRFSSRPSASLFEDGHNVLARFEACTFAGGITRVGIRSGAVLFDRCRFIDMPYLPRVQGDCVQFDAPETVLTQKAARRRAVVELNAGWKLR